MRPFIEKPSGSEPSSFFVRRFSTPDLEVPWHQHVECELILFIEGEGLYFIGNQAGEFQTGDVFFLGAHLPHTFQNPNPGRRATAIVLQFREDCLGSEFTELAECRRLRQLLQVALRGLKLSGALRAQTGEWLHQLDRARDLRRIALLCFCLDAMAAAAEPEYEVLSTQMPVIYNDRNQQRVDTIIRYTIDHFREAIRLEQVAALLGMSETAFCNYFKRTTKKTYIDFLNELRIGYACRQLVETDKTIQQIGFDSGFNTIANFNKQFVKLRRVPPSSWRRAIPQDLLTAIR